MEKLFLSAGLANRVLGGVAGFRGGDDASGGDSDGHLSRGVPAARNRVLPESHH